MKLKLLLSFLATVIASTAYADCSFTYVNKSHYTVTLQGYFLDDGDGLTNEGWVSVEPTRQVTQVRGGKKCNSLFHHTGQLVTRIVLKNNSGYLIGNKGFLFAADRSYSHYANGNSAMADDGSKITLSNAQRINGKEFKVVICNANIDSDDCK